MRDGLYRVVYGSICAGFVIHHGQAVSCAPVLRSRIAYWKTIAKRISA